MNADASLGSLLAYRRRSRAHSEAQLCDRAPTHRSRRAGRAVRVGAGRVEACASRSTHSRACSCPPSRSVTVADDSSRGSTSAAASTVACSTLRVPDWAPSTTVDPRRTRTTRSAQALRAARERRLAAPRWRPRRSRLRTCLRRDRARSVVLNSPREQADVFALLGDGVVTFLKSRGVTIDEIERDRAESERRASDEVERLRKHRAKQTQSRSRSICARRLDADVASAAASHPRARAARSSPTRTEGSWSRSPRG